MSISYNGRQAFCEMLVPITCYEKEIQFFIRNNFSMFLTNKDCRIENIETCRQLTKSDSVNFPQNEAKYTGLLLETKKYATQKSFIENAQKANDEIKLFNEIPNSEKFALAEDYILINIIYKYLLDARPAIGWKICPCCDDKVPISSCKIHEYVNKDSREKLDYVDYATVNIELSECGKKMLFKNLANYAGSNATLESLVKLPEKSIIINLEDVRV